MDRPEMESPEYKKWRLEVYKRDKFKCILCGNNKGLNAHHIKLWALYPELRYSKMNGCTLCKSCHRKVTGHEEAYEQQLTELVNRYNKYSKHDIAKILRGLK